MRLLLIIFLIISTNIYAQDVRGRIYDSEGILKDFEIWNTTQQLSSFSDAKGYFDIKAEIGDSIYFNSITHVEHIHIVRQEDLNEIIVIDLKNNINQLDEVNLNSNKEEFVVVEFNKEFRSEIEEDRKKNRYQYVVPNSKGNIYTLLEEWYRQIFPKDPVIETISYQDLKALFSTDIDLNPQFLSIELQIPEEQHKFFFDYVESKSWDANLLQKTNRLALIQKLYESSEEFLARIRTNALEE